MEYSNHQVTNSCVQTLQSVAYLNCNKNPNNLRLQSQTHSGVFVLYETFVCSKVDWIFDSL